MIITQVDTCYTNNVTHTIESKYQSCICPSDSFLASVNTHWSSSLRAFTPRPLVICGPSGSGKSTLLKRLMNEFGDFIGFSVSRKFA